jgi:hypothetical protein
VSRLSKLALKQQHISFSCSQFRRSHGGHVGIIKIITNTKTDTVLVRRRLTFPSKLCSFLITVTKTKTKLHGLSPRANYTDQATAACGRSDCQLFADRGCHVDSVTDPYGRILGFLDRSCYFLKTVKQSNNYITGLSFGKVG